MHNIGALLALSNALLLSITMTIAKKISPDIPTLLIVFIRSLFGFFFFIPFIVIQRKKINKSAYLNLYLLKLILGIVAMFCTYYTYRNLPITVATTFGMTGVLFTTLLSGLLLREYISSIKWICITCGYLGVLLVTQPYILVFNLAIITSLLANILAAFNIVVTKILSRKDSIITIMIYSNIGVTIIAGILSINQWQSLALSDILLLLLIGIFGFASQAFNTIALKYATPSFLAPFDYTRLIFALFIGVFFLKEVPNIYTIMGGIIIIVTTYIITKIEKK